MRGSYAEGEIRALRANASLPKESGKNAAAWEWGLGRGVGRGQ